jgi:hypothetical protein
MDLRLATLKVVSFYFLHNASNTESMQKLILCKHFASYQGYPNYIWDLIWYSKV